MSNKKHIDRLFQEQFKAFEATPNPEVWENIQQTLNKKEEKRRVIPIWFKYAGIAAVVVMIFTFGNVFLNTNKRLNPVVNSAIDSLNTNENTLKKDSRVIVDKQPKLEELSTEEAVVETLKNETELKETDTNTNTNTTPKRQPVKTPKSNGYNENVVINNSNQNQNNFNTTVSNSTLNTTYQKLSLNTSEIISEKWDKPFVDRKNNTQNDLENIASTSTEKLKNETVKDSISNTILEKKSIEEALAEKEEELEVPKTPYKKWDVKTNIAPVYYNTLGKGSHLDEQFVSNSKTGGINTSYGMQVGFAISDKLTLRTGLNTMDLSYTTNDVILYEREAVSADVEIDPEIGSDGDILGSSGVLISPFSNVVLNQQSSQQIGVFSYFEGGFVEGNNGAQRNSSISQRVNYFEIPLELDYKLINKKFGLSIQGGVSTFILNDNSVVSKIDGDENEIGEATNLNSISYSTNLGFGIDYKFSKVFSFNLEPKFKYQFNAYENTSGDFKPYIIGVYTGFSFKF